MSTVLHKHSKFIIQTPHSWSGFAQLFDKHSLYTVMGRTEEKLSFKRREIIWIRETHSALYLRIHLKMGVLTQAKRDFFLQTKPVSGQRSQQRIPSRTWAGLVDFSPAGAVAVTAGIWSCPALTGRAPADTEMCARDPAFICSNTSEKRERRDSKGSQPFIRHFCWVKIEQHEQWHHSPAVDGTFGCTSSTEFLDLFNSDYELGPLLCIKLPSAENVKRFRNIIPPPQVLQALKSHFNWFF